MDGATGSHLDVVVAVLGGLVSIAVALLAARSAARTQVQKHEHDRELQEQKLRAELRLEFMAEEAVRQLLSIERWKKRSFEEISRRLGGFTDEELRRVLVRAGAVRFSAEGDKELWGLRERNRGDLE